MLKITNLKKSYKQKVVLDGLNFKLKQKTIKALIGVNGAGKSTLIELICGVKKFNEGSILINGIDSSDKKNAKTLKYTFGYMPQSFCLYNDLTVRENLEYLTSIYKIDVDVTSLIKTCNLEEHEMTLAGNLSGGYKQLLSLAGALVHSPELLILDEPTSAMDPIFRRKFWHIIKDYNKKGKTVLVITHYLEELLECQSFACLSKGKISYDGNVSEFKKEGFVNIEEVLKKFS